MRVMVVTTYRVAGRSAEGGGGGRSAQGGGGGESGEGGEAGGGGAHIGRDLKTRTKGSQVGRDNGRDRTKGGEVGTMLVTT